MYVVCAQGLPENGLRRIILTASGGAFRDWPVEKLKEVRACSGILGALSEAPAEGSRQAGRGAQGEAGTAPADAWGRVARVHWVRR